MIDWEQDSHRKWDDNLDLFGAILSKSIQTKAKTPSKTKAKKKLPTTTKKKTPKAAKKTTNKATKKTAGKGRRGDPSPEMRVKRGGQVGEAGSGEKKRDDRDVGECEKASASKGGKNATLVQFWSAGLKAARKEIMEETHRDLSAMFQLAERMHEDADGMRARKRQLDAIVARWLHDNAPKSSPVSQPSPPFPPFSLALPPSSLASLALPPSSSLASLALPPSSSLASLALPPSSSLALPPSAGGSSAWRARSRVRTPSLCPRIRPNPRIALERIRFIQISKLAHVP
jgi:hypothetical protein